MELLVPIDANDNMVLALTMMVATSLFELEIGPCSSRGLLSQIGACEGDNGEHGDDSPESPAFTVQVVDERQCFHKGISLYHKLFGVILPLVQGRWKVEGCMVWDLGFGI
ncbi:hypothetical protein RIF29_24315 [Crotalaria pallida]|uniref:Uncharacterized protein n=1 Tax=Crotalaria pallida TaxID=3830 RepID=A0AAN9EK50_CROPI